MQPIHQNLWHHFIIEITKANETEVVKSDGNLCLGDEHKEKVVYPS